MLYLLYTVSVPDTYRDPQPIESRSVPISVPDLPRLIQMCEITDESEEEDGELDWSTIYRCPALTKSIPREHRIRNVYQRHRCPDCHSLLFKQELTQGRNGKFGRCCNNGNIKLPPIPVVPDELNTIFRQQTYLEMSRRLNHTLVFACWKCNENKSLLGRHHGISCIRVQGCAYMLIGSIEPEKNEKPPNHTSIL